MSSPDQSSAAAQVPEMAARPRRYFLRAALLFSVVGVVATPSYYLWCHAKKAVPPEVEVTHADPDVAKAIQRARELVLAESGNAQAWGNLAMILHAHDYHSQAQTCYAEAEKLDRRNPRWPYLQAICAGQLGSNDMIDCLQRSAECQGPDQVPLVKLGETFLEQGRVDEAEKSFENVLEAEAENARAHLGLARVLTARGDLHGSVAHLEKSIATENQFQPTFEMLATAYHALGEVEKAKNLRQELIRRSPMHRTWPDPFLDRVKEFETGLPVAVRRAKELFDAGKTSEAIQYMRELSEKRPKSATTRAGLGRMLVLTEQPAEAIEQLEFAIQLDPKLSIAHFFLGAAYVLQDRYLEAETAFRRSIELQPDHAEAHYELARVLYKLQDREGAARSAQDCLRYDPSFTLAAKLAGVARAEQGDYEKALLHLTQAASLSPEDREIDRLLKLVRAKQAENAARP